MLGELEKQPAAQLGALACFVLTVLVEASQGTGTSSWNKDRRKLINDVLTNPAVRKLSPSVEIEKALIEMGDTSSF